ncbi:MAG: GIY-YIG nuclease family protein [Candidatus Taylorbacteria bacterium]
MIRQYINRLELPREPGIYIFRDYRKKPLYIGRATSLRDRIRSYFLSDLIETRGSRIVDMVTKAKSITYEKTDSVLESIILEGSLIKQYQPYFNVSEKDDKSSQYVVITDEAWPRVFLARARDLEASKKNGSLSYKIKELFGPYPHAALIKEALRILRKMFPFKDKKSYDPRHDRFYRSIGRSPENDEKIDTEARKKYIKTINYLILFFKGKKQIIRDRIAKDMAEQAKAMKFEDAMISKKLLFALNHINEIALIKNDGNNSMNSDTHHREHRIEAYDIAHLSGTNVVGAMVVMINGEMSPPDHRKFIIHKQKNDDIAGLGEMVFRRLNHTEWTYPDLIVVDGNQNQIKIVENILKSRRIEVPIVAVTKNDKHRATSLIGDESITTKFNKAIIQINAEAHRSALAFHRKKRRII